MLDENPIYVVTAAGEPLREGPDAVAPALVGLAAGQIVARLDAVDRGGWLHVFADTPGDGAYVGYLRAEALASWPEGPAAEPPADHAADPAPIRETGGSEPDRE